jgi:hypothetical protein
LTTGTNESAGLKQKNQINLILIDPFFTETQVAHFKSTTFYDNDIFSANDTMICSIIQSTMAMKRDNLYKTYFWTQFPSKLVKSKMLRDLDDIDSDESGDEDIEEDEKDILGRIEFSQVPMFNNDRDFIYYVTRLNGKCIIMEGNPRDPYINNH